MTTAVDRGDEVEVTEGAEAKGEGEAEAKGAEAKGEEAEAKGEEAEAKGEVEAKGEAEAKGEEPLRDDKGRFIPVSRHKDVLEKERGRADAAERALNELRGQLNEQSKSADVQRLETEIVALEETHTQALLDGDKATAAQAMREIRHKEREIARAEAEAMSDRKSDQAVERVRFDTAVERLESIYPALNPEAKEYDEELVNLVLASQRQFVEVDRMRPAEALVKAAELVVSKFVAAAPVAVEKKGLAQAADRTVGQKTKNVAVTAAQPAALKEAGKDSDKAGLNENIDVTRLSEDEFAALPAATRARLRGDML